MEAVAASRRTAEAAARRLVDATGGEEGGGGGFRWGGDGSRRRSSGRSAIAGRARTTSRAGGPARLEARYLMTDDVAMAEPRPILPYTPSSLETGYFLSFLSVCHYKILK